jgi:hypothetical protein
MQITTSRYEILLRRKHICGLLSFHLQREYPEIRGLRLRISMTPRHPGRELSSMEADAVIMESVAKNCSSTLIGGPGCNDSAARSLRRFFALT